MTAYPTRLRTLLEQRHWKYERFRRHFEQAAKELALGNMTIGRRQFERWVEGRIKTMPRPDACLVLEHLFGEPVEQLLTAPSGIPQPHTRGQSVATPLTVAIGVVVHGDQVLLIRRRSAEGMLDWQFPAGIVKPSELAARVVVDEIYAETAVAVKLQRHLGERIHPATGAHCVYFLCQYLHGTVSNCDPQENSDVLWISREALDRYIDPSMVFPAVRDVLRGSLARDAS